MALVLRVLLPTARVGLVTAMILGIARVAGETAPVLFTAGGNSTYNWNPFSGKQDDLPLRVYELIFQPGVNTTRDAWGVAFVLVLVVLTLFVLARLIGAKKPGPSGFTVPWRTRVLRGRGSLSVSERTQKTTEKVISSPPDRISRTNETKESRRMRTVERATVTRPTAAPRLCRGVLGVALLCVLAVAAVALPAGADDRTTNRSALERANATAAPISGTGSSFASPAIDTWVNATHNAPYSLSINWAPSNSGTGRYEFTNQTTDFAVSDIGYVGNTDTTPPSFPFNFIPITAGGIAFMYNVPGLTKQLQLSSQTACGLLTGGINNWNSQYIAADNPGVSLPNLAVKPVTESDSAGTNYVLEEWCIDEQPALWAAFVHAQETQSGGPTDGVAISATSPNSNWPGVQGGLDDQSTTAVASDVANNPGAMGAVQVKYAEDDNFYGTNPAQNVALGEERQ